MASNFPIQIVNPYPANRVRHYPVTAAQTFVTGALVFLTSGAVSECGADPSAILGIALGNASVALDSRGSIFGSVTKGSNLLPVFTLTPDDVLFMASATTPVYATHVNGNGGAGYGIEKTTNWRVDISDTSASRVHILDISIAPLQEGFFVRFRPNELQLDAIAS